MLCAAPLSPPECFLNEHAGWPTLTLTTTTNGGKVVISLQSISASAALRLYGQGGPLPPPSDLERFPPPPFTKADYLHISPPGYLSLGEKGSRAETSSLRKRTSSRQPLTSRSTLLSPLFIDPISSSLHFPSQETFASFFIKCIFDASRSSHRTRILADPSSSLFLGPPVYPLPLFFPLQPSHS